MPKLDNTFELLILAAIAPFIGSFLGVLAMRLPEHRPVLIGRSHCDRCGHALGARDLIPLASWALSRGRCRYCAAPLGLFYPTIEVAAFGVVVWAATMTSGWILLASCLFGWTLLALAFADWRSGVLPDALTYSLLGMGLAAAYVLDPSTILDRLIGAAAGFLFFAGLRLLYRTVRGRDGLGLGDAKLLAGLGAWVSWNGLPTVIVFASGLALAFVASRALAGKRIFASDRLSFGPYLAAAGWLVWLYGPLSAN